MRKTALFCIESGYIVQYLVQAVNNQFDFCCTLCEQCGLFRPLVGRLEGVHHLEHAVALAGAEVEDALARVLRHVGDRRDVAAREVHDVDIVAHARAVRRVIVVAKDAQRRPMAVCGYRADAAVCRAARVRADGVVAQQHDRPAPGRPRH